MTEPDDVQEKGESSSPLATPELEGSKDLSRALQEAERWRFGGFEIIRELGRGGMGEVYLARQISLDRLVALKLISGIHPSSESLRRFIREAKAAGSINHPCIVSVYEAGEEGGRHYIAMRYVDGEPLSKKIKSAMESRRGAASPTPIQLPGPSPGERKTATGPERPRSRGMMREEILRVLHLFERTAEALHEAHEVGLIHRDIKPGNIMVTKDGEPVIVDFGLARLQEEESGTVTRPGELVGTPPYMSPEQVAGGHIKIDRRTDVYSLGVTLYECLTLRSPFTGPSHAAVFDQILHSDPPDPARLNPSISRDLRVVLETAMDKNRNRRYPTALAFAEDLRRIREHEPIKARPAGLLLKLGRWCQRNPVASMAAGALLLLAATVIGMLWLRLQENQGHGRVIQATRLVAESAAVLPRDPGLALLLAMEVGRTRENHGVRAENALYAALTSEDFREVKTLSGHEDEVRDVAFNADGTRLASVSMDATGRVWDLESLKFLYPLKGHAKGIHSVCFSPPGVQPAQLLTASEDGTAILWPAVGAPGEGPRPRTILRAPRDTPVRYASYSPDGTHVVTICADRTARIWDIRAAGAELTEPARSIAAVDRDKGRLSMAVFHPDGKRLFTASEDGFVKIWDWQKGEKLGEIDAEARDRLRFVQLSPDGGRMVTGAGDHEARVWDLSGGEAAPKEISRLKGHLGSVKFACFDAEGRRVLTSSWDMTARVWDAETGRSSFTLSGHKDFVRSARFSPGGDWMATASADGTVKIWSLRARKLDLLVGEDKSKKMPKHEQEVTAAAFSGDGRLIATASREGKVKVLELSTGRVIDLGVESPELPPESEWNSMEENRPRLILGFSPDSKKLAAASSISVRNAAAVWDLSGPLPPVKPPVVLDGHAGKVSSVAFGDGRRVATGSWDKTVKIWDAESGKVLSTMQGHEREVRSVSFSTDGKWVVSASDDRTAKIWEAETGALLRTLAGHEQPIVSVAFSPDGSRVLTASRDSTARIWDVATGRKLVLLQGQGGYLRFAAFSPDGQRVVTVARSKPVVLWDARDGRKLFDLPGKTEDAHSAAFSPDGKSVLVAASTTTSLWTLRDPYEVAQQVKPRDLTPEEREKYGLPSPAAPDSAPGTGE